MPTTSPGRSPNLLFDVWLLSRALTSVLDDALAPAGLTADEFAVYSVLTSGPMTPTDLASWMSAPLTTVSSYVKRFEARGHVTRQANEADGRSYRLALTESGLQAHRRAGACFLPVLASVEGVLGLAVDDVRAAVAAARGAVTEAAAPPGPEG